MKARNSAGLSSQSSFFNAALTQPPAVTVSFEQVTYSVDEGQNVAILLDDDPLRTITVTNQNGAPDADYSGILSDVTFNSVETRLTITLTATDDSEVDDGENVALSCGTQEHCLLKLFEPYLRLDY